MLRRAVLFCLILVFPTAGHAGEPQCLPKSLFAKTADADPEVQLRLGFAKGVLTACVPGKANGKEDRTCFAVDAKTGALSDSAATRLMGRSEPSAPIRPSGCVQGFCVTPKPGADDDVLFATSTDEAHAVILVNDGLHVFDAKTKAQTAVIPLNSGKAANDTDMGLSPDAILYLGHTLFVIGGAAAPFKAVWLYGDDGKRLGSIKDPRPARAGEDVPLLSVYPGAANIIDDRHVALANTGLQTIEIFDDTGKKVDTLERPVAAGPCTAKEINNVGYEDINLLPASCKAHVRKAFEPFFDVDLVRLPTGDMLVALSGRYTGSLAVLDGKTLVEKRRIALKRCGR